MASKSAGGGRKSGMGEEKFKAVDTLIKTILELISHSQEGTDENKKRDRFASS